MEKRPILGIYRLFYSILFVLVNFLPKITVAENKKDLKVYVAPDKTVYWPIDLPVFVRLATSKDATESFPLSKFHLKTAEGKQKELANKGIKLEQGGSQYIRWVNSVTKNNILFKFIADDGAPATQIQYLNCEKYNQFLGPGAEIKLTANDNHSGVKNIYYNLDKSQTQKFQKDIKLTEEKTYQLAYNAVDNVGYKGQLTNVQFTLDITPPNGRHKFQSQLNSNILAIGDKILLSAEDRLSGVREILYKFNNEKNYKKYTSPINTQNLLNGTHVLSYYTIDNVGNSSEPKLVEFFYDIQPPEIAHNFIGPFFKEKNYTYISPITKVQFFANDINTQTNVIKFRLNDKKTFTYKGPIAFDNKQGSQKLDYFAIDNLGNKGPTSRLNLRIDFIGPQTNIQFIGNTFKRLENTVYITDKTGINILAKDQDSGSESKYTQIGLNPPKKFQDVFNITKQGKVLFRYWAQDKVGNLSAIKSLLIVVDNIPPEIIIDHNTSPTARDLASVKDEKKKSMPTYPVGTLISINSVDAQSGVKNLFIKFNGKEVVKKNNNFLIKKAGEYKIEITSIDNLGNKSERVLWNKFVK